MKTIAKFTDNEGCVTGIVSGPDYCNQEITVNGKVWRFDFDSYAGPLWLKKNGEPRKCQCPTVKAVWDEFQKWHETIKD